MHIPPPIPSELCIWLVITMWRLSSSCLLPDLGITDENYLQSDSMSISISLAWPLCGMATHCTRVKLTAYLHFTCKTHASLPPHARTYHMFLVCVRLFVNLVLWKPFLSLTLWPFDACYPDRRRFTCRPCVRGQRWTGWLPEREWGWENWRLQMTRPGGWGSTQTPTQSLYEDIACFFY